MSARQARGDFDVTVTPQPAEAGIGDESIGRMALSKRFHGDLDAIASGQMLATRTPTPGSAAYVALDRVTGSLHGRNGSFSLQHAGTMDRGAPTLEIRVVPDSGTGELQGITGQLRIRIDGARHSYEFDYELPEA